VLFTQGLFWPWLGEGEKSGRLLGKEKALIPVETFALCVLKKCPYRGLASTSVLANAIK
jgi:hypothetical protein